MKRDGNELTGLGKIAYKPFGLAFGMLGGLIAGKVFGLIWKKVSREDETPQPLSDDYSTREVLLAATLQGAVFGLIKTAVDRYGMKGVRRFLDAPRPPSERAAAARERGVDRVGGDSMGDRVADDRVEV